MRFAGGCGEGIGTGEGVGDRETFGFQRIHQGIGDGRLVFYQQDSWHGGISTSLCEMPMKKG
jgi:hypothetical protein